MAQLFLGSELLETELTPSELNTAMQLSSKDLSIAYLQNTRVGIFRNLANQQFDDPAEDAKNHRMRVHLQGQLHILDALIEGAMNPTPVPLDTSNQG